MNKNTPQDRRVVTYLPPKHHRLFEAYAKYEELSESAAAVKLIAKVLDEIPHQERERIINYSKNSY